MALPENTPPAEPPSPDPRAARQLAAQRRLNRVRRVLALGLIGAAVIVLIVYVLGRRQAGRARTAADLQIPTLGLQVQQSAHGVMVSKDSNGHPVFRVMAQRAEKMRGTGEDRLYNVRVLAYNANGEYADEISGDAFGFNQSSGQLVAAGLVHIVLQTRPHASARGTGGKSSAPVRVEARDLSYNVKTGRGTIAQGVDFTYQDATGHAGQGQLDSRAGVLTLTGGVRVHWSRSKRPDVIVTGGQARLRRVDPTAGNTRNGALPPLQLTLENNASLHAGPQSLTADRFVFDIRGNQTLSGLDAQGHVHALDATPGRTVTATSASGHAGFAALGPHRTVLSSLDLGGGVSMEDVSGTRRDRLQAQNVVLVMNARHQLSELKALGHAQLLSSTRRGGRAVGPVGQVGAEGREIHTAAARPPKTLRRGPARAGAPGVPSLAERQAGGVATPRQAPRQSNVPGASARPSSPLVQKASAPEIDFQFAPGSSPSATSSARLQDIVAQGGAVIEFTPPGASEVDVRAARFHLALGPDNRPVSADASGDVEVRQTVAGVVRSSRSDRLALTFAPASVARQAGGVAQPRHPSRSMAKAGGVGGVQLRRLVADGDVTVSEAGRSIQADRLSDDAATGRVELYAHPNSAFTHGLVRGRDAQTRFTASHVVWTTLASGAQRLQAGGGVSLSRASTAVMNTTLPVVITAGSLDWTEPARRAGRPRATTLPLPGATLPGVAVFSGHVRVLQAPNLLRADRITLNGARSTLQAQGQVQADFVPSSAGAPGAAAAGLLAATGPKSGAGVPLVHVDADRLEFSQRLGQAEFLGHVEMLASGTQLAAPRLVLTLAPSSSNGTAAGMPAAAARLSTALASGGVRISQPGRTATADQARFDFKTELATLTGGPPSIFDAEQGRISGDPLTFSMANDEIQVGSKTGGRASGQTDLHK